MKKVLYVYLGDFNEKSGVTNKLRGLINAFTKINAELSLFTLSSAIYQKGSIERNVYALPYRDYKNIQSVYEQLDTFLSESKAFDVYFFRYPTANAALVKFLKRHPGKFIFEHNTKELPEIKQSAKAWIKKYKFSLSPSYVRLILSTYIRPLFNEYVYSVKAMRLAKGGVAVTNEIAGYERSRLVGYKCSILSNGIDVESIRFYNRTVRDEKLNLIMLVNSNSVWHGVDLIVKALNDYKKDDICLTLVGKIDEDLKTLAGQNKNIILTGHLNSDEYQESVKLAHVGVGSLAMHRITLKEASTLKVREYLASGLPVFLGYEDTDMGPSSGLAPYNYRQEGESINLKAIYTWATKLYSDENLNSKIREEAQRQIDFSIRAKAMLELENL